MRDRLKLVVLITTLIFAVKGYSQEANLKGSEEKVEQTMPSFPGGDNAFYDYLDAKVVLPEGFDKVKYLEENKNQFVPVSVGFTIDVDGSIIDVKLIENVDELLDEKAKEIVAKMPTWNPGTQNGKPIKVQYAIPVRFNLL